MHDEGVLPAFAALGGVARAGRSGAKFGRPGKAQDVVVENAGRSGFAMTAAGTGGRDGREKQQTHHAEAQSTRRKRREFLHPVTTGPSPRASSSRINSRRRSAALTAESIAIQ